MVGGVVVASIAEISPGERRLVLGNLALLSAGWHLPRILLRLLTVIPLFVHHTNCLRLNSGVKSYVNMRVSAQKFMTRSAEPTLCNCLTA